LATGNNAQAFLLNNHLVAATSVKFDVVINATAGVNLYPATAVPAANGNPAIPACGNTSQLALRARVKSVQVITTKTIAVQVVTPAVVNATTGAVITPAVTANTQTVTVTQAVQFGNNSTPLGFFTWSPTAVVNGNPATTAPIVIAAVLPVLQKDPDDVLNIQDDPLGIFGEDALAQREVNQQTSFSFVVNRPNTIFWDPEIGYAPITTATANTASSSTGTTGTTGTTGAGGATLNSASNFLCNSPLALFLIVATFLAARQA